MKSLFSFFFHPPSIDHKKVVAAIAAAEAKTSGEIRVVLVHHVVNDPVAEAQREFVKLGMTQTKHRNGILILLAPRSRKFAVVGDTGIHAQCGEGFWTELAASMSSYFRSGKFTYGLEHGIKWAGESLAKFFPAEPDDRDELPNDIVERP